MATLTVIKPGYTAAAMGAGTACAAGGDQFLNDGLTMLRFTNTDGSPVTVTVDSQTTCNYGSDHNITATVAATTGDVVLGPFPKARFDDANDYVQLTYSAVTALKVWPISAGGV